MPEHIVSSDTPLRKIAQELGLALQALYERGRTALPGDMLVDEMKSYMPPNDHRAENLLLGALSILYTMGLLTLEPNGLVIVSSRHAHFAIGSLSKFLVSATRAIDSPLSKNPYQSIAQFTTTLEAVRVNTPGVDHTPLHSRRVVNLLIKSQQSRPTGLEDVYLFVYRPDDWDQYHLIGYSKYHETQSDDYVAQQAMKEHLGVEDNQYSLAPARPEDVKKVILSIPNGVWTEYTFHMRVVDQIRVPLRPRHPERLRWFTWDEILRRSGPQQEVIMESSSTIMNGLGDLSAVPRCRIPSNHDFATPSLSTGPRRSIRWSDYALVVLILIVSGFLVFRSAELVSRIKFPQGWLETSAQIAQILGYLLPLTALPKMYRILGSWWASLRARLGHGDSSS